VAESVAAPAAAPQPAPALFGVAGHSLRLLSPLPLPLPLPPLLPPPLLRPRARGAAAAGGGGGAAAPRARRANVGSFRNAGSMWRARSAVKLSATGLAPGPPAARTTAQS
jgi:hypothetical protein